MCSGMVSAVLEIENKDPYLVAKRCNVDELTGVFFMTDKNEYGHRGFSVFSTFKSSC